MAATTFTWTPSFPASQENKPAARVVKFGDGYEQRLRYGLRTDLKSWRLVFQNRTNAEASQISEFLYARGAVEQFNWTTPFGVTAAWVCEEWNLEHVSCNNNTITATFRQVIDL